MLILFEHSAQKGLGEGIYLLILFSTLLAAADIHKMETKRGLHDDGGPTYSGQTDHEILRDPAPVRSKGCAGLSSSSTRKKRKRNQCTACNKFGHNKQTCERRRHRANTSHSPDADRHDNEFSDDSLHNDLD